MNSTRNTKYTKELQLIIERLGHATNSELQKELMKIFPDVSATTIHRITARMLERGELIEAPADSQGSMRFDSTLSPHDHFICQGCEGIRNLDIARDFLPKISKELGGCKITGRLVIHGSCEKCLKKNKGV
jgi:Fe2+ or Zn2+ uptake regulation protein